MNYLVHATDEGKEELKKVGTIVHQTKLKPTLVVFESGKSIEEIESIKGVTKVEVSRTFTLGVEKSLNS